MLENILEWNYRKKKRKIGGVNCKCTDSRERRRDASCWRSRVSNGSKTCLVNSRMPERGDRSRSSESSRELSMHQRPCNRTARSKSNALHTSTNKCSIKRLNTMCCKKKQTKKKQTKNPRKLHRTSGPQFV